MVKIWQTISTGVGCLCLLLWVGCQSPKESTPKLPEQWSDILLTARGSELTMMMWQGDPVINAYMNEFVKPRVKEEFDITLSFANGQGNVIVQALFAEQQAGLERSNLDLVWINGETFYQLRELEALYGPFVHRLPNARLIDVSNPFIGKDFQQNIDGYECPWGNVQMTWIYNHEKVDRFPQDREELLAFVQAHPGVFTWDRHFTGMTLLKSWLMDIAPQGSLYGAFDENRYQQYSRELWQYIDLLKPYLWRKGATFPSSVAPMHQMFQNEELWFTFSNNDAEVENKIYRNIFDTTARAAVPAYGSVQNSHFLGIPKQSSRKAAAMVVINFLISPEAQLEKSKTDVWGDGPVISMDQLTDKQQQLFEKAMQRTYAPERSSIDSLALQELDPQYMIRLYEDFQNYMEGKLDY